MRCVYSRACAAGALTLALAAGARADLDAIGTSPAATDGGFWLNSTTNTDAGGDVATCAGVGLITIPAGHRLTEIQAVIGTRGPAGSGSANLAAITTWHVELWSTPGAFGAAPTHGDVASFLFHAPTNTDFATPYGTDSTGRPTSFVRFRLPAGIAVSQTSPTLFAVRADMSQSALGSIGVLESTIAGSSGLWASHSLPAPGYAAFNTLPVSSRSGVFAYRVVTGCPADYNASGSLEVQDIFDFLNDWFAQAPGTDINGDAHITVQDIFDFLAAWFSGC